MKHILPRFPLAFSSILTLLIVILFTYCKNRSSEIRSTPSSSQQLQTNDPTYSDKQVVPITDAMVKIAEEKGLPFLATTLRELQRNNHVEINKPASDKLHTTALHQATKLGNPDILKALLTREADVSAQDSEGNTPLHIAAHDGLKETVEFLVKHYNNLNKENNDKATPLDMAASEGHKNIVKILIEKGADVNRKNKEGFTLLDMAAIEGDWDLIKFLLDHGAQVNYQEGDEFISLHF